MCRLAIRDPAQGRQPFWRDDVGVIFNGEIYNTDELRRTLHRRGHKFATSCDTEVVLAGYLEFGSAVFGLFDGIFAVAIVDQPNNRFVLARDEFGVKPLFVRSTNGSVAFASEPKALRELGALSDGIDLTAIHAYLRHQYVPEPDSPWRNVRRVPRGSAEIYSLDEVRLLGVERFQQPPADVGDGDWVEATRAAVDLSVRRQLVSDRPLGVFLSGGIDSTLVSAAAADAHPGIRAFGISVPGWERDERRYMEEAARHLDVDLVITELHESDFERLLDQLIDVYDEPFADYSAIPTMLVSEVAANDLRVVLTGDGGDELFGGYGRYDAAFRLQAAGAVPGALSVLAGRVFARLPRYGSTAERLLDQTRDEVRNGGYGYGSMLAIQTETSVDTLLGGRRVPPRPIVPATRRPRPWDRLDAARAGHGCRHRAVPPRGHPDQGRPGDDGGVPRGPGAAARSARRPAGLADACRGEDPPRGGEVAAQGDPPAAGLRRRLRRPEEGRVLLPDRGNGWCAPSAIARTTSTCSAPRRHPSIPWPRARCSTN